MALEPEETKERPTVTWEQTRAILDREMPPHTFRPVVGGSLAIVAGYLNILAGVMTLIRFNYFPLVNSFVSTVILTNIGIDIFGIAMIVLGAVSMIGGSYATRRRVHPLALTGAITSLFPSLAIIPGTISLVLVGSSRNEFHKPSR